MLVVGSGVLVALATLLLVLGLVTAGGLVFVVGSVVASLTAAMLLVRHQRKVISSG